MQILVAYSYNYMYSVYIQLLCVGYTYIHLLLSVKMYKYVLWILFYYYA